MANFDFRFWSFSKSEVKLHQKLTFFVDFNQIPSSSVQKTDNFRHKTITQLPTGQNRNELLVHFLLDLFLIWLVNFRRKVLFVLKIDLSNLAICLKNFLVKLEAVDNSEIETVEFNESDTETIDTMEPGQSCSCIYLYSPQLLQ